MSVREKIGQMGAGVAPNLRIPVECTLGRVWVLAVITPKNFSVT